MSFLASLLAQATEGGSAGFNPSTLGMAAVFVVMLALLARYTVQLIVKLNAVQDARVADGVAHASVLREIVDEQTQATRDLAVVLDRVQNGLSKAITRTSDASTSSTDDIAHMMDTLAKNQEALSKRLQGMG